MGRRIAAFAAALAVVSALAAPAGAQAPRTARWSANAPDSQRVERGGIVTKTLTIDGTIVSATISDAGTHFRVDLSLSSGPRTLEVDPKAMRLDAVAPSPDALAFVPAERIASTIEREAAMRAASRELSGAHATKTVTTTHVGWTDSPGSPVYDSSSSPRFESKTVTETVPDEHARSSARHDADQIRSQAGTQSAEIRRAALAQRTVPQLRSVAGAVFFERDTDALEVVLRVPLGDVVAEIPFTATARRRLLAKQIRFE